MQAYVPVTRYGHAYYCERAQYQNEVHDQHCSLAYRIQQLGVSRAFPSVTNIIFCVGVSMLVLLLKKNLLAQIPCERKQG